jgi:hypothetical protein
MPDTPAQLETQLAALAAAAERANRPASYFTIPALLAAGALVFCAWSARGLVRERNAVAARQAQLVRVTQLTEQIKEASKKSVSLDSLYPPAPFFGSQVGDDTWRHPSRGFREPPTVTASTSTRVDATSSIHRNDVTVTVNNEPIEKVLQAIDATLNFEHLKGRAFVSQANFTPSGTGWRAIVRFSLYEKK